MSGYHRDVSRTFIARMRVEVGREAPEVSG